MPTDLFSQAGIQMNAPKNGGGIDLFEKNGIEPPDNHKGAMSKVSALDYWIKNPAKSAAKSYVNDTKDIYSAIPKNFEQGKQALKGIGNVVTHPLDTVVNAVKSVPDMFMNHPLQTAAMLAPGAEGAVGLAEKGISAAKSTMSDIGKTNLENKIFGLYNSSVGAKVKNLGELNKVKPQKIEALKTMSDNLPNVKLESGEEIPKNRWDLAQVLKQTKAAIYEQYNKLSLDASDSGAEIDMRPIVQRAYQDTIKKLGQDTITANPGLLNAIKQEAMNELKIGKTNPTRAQVHMQSLNDDVKASYNSGNAVHYSVVDFKRSLLNHLNDATESSIEEALNKSGYGALRDKYAALKASEKEILSGANKYLRQSGGQGGMTGSVVNLWSMEELMQAGVKAATGNLGGAAIDVGKATILQAAKKMVNHLTSPDVKIPKMFDLLKKYEGKKTNIGGEVNAESEVSPYKTPPNPVKAELVEPLGIGVDKPKLRSDRALPSPKKAGSSSGPTIKQGGEGQTKIGQEKKLALPSPTQVKGDGFTFNDPPKHKIISEKEAGRNPMDEDNEGVILHKRDIDRAKEMAQIDKETEQEMKKTSLSFLKSIKGKIASEYGKQGHFMFEEYEELKKAAPDMFSPKGMKPDIFASEIGKKYPEYFNYKDPETITGEDLVQAVFMAKKFKGGK